MINLDTATIIGLLVSYVIPLLSSLLARTSWPGEAIGLLTTALAAVNGVLVEWAGTGGGFDWRHAFEVALASWLIAAFARVQTWRHTKTDAKALAIGSKTA